MKLLFIYVERERGLYGASLNFDGLERFSLSPIKGKMGEVEFGYGIRDYLEVLIAEGARNLLIGRVPTLRRIVKVVDTYLPANVFYGPIKKSDRRSAAYARVNAALKKIFDYDKFMDWGDGGKPTRGGRALAIELSKRIKYCPYCNAETVSAFRFTDKPIL